MRTFRVLLIIFTQAYEEETCNCHRRIFIHRKSSISKIIARELGIIHMDTGALYRGITVFAIQYYLENNSINIPLLISHLNDINLEFRNIDGNLQLF